MILNDEEAIALLIEAQNTTDVKRLEEIAARLRELDCIASAEAVERKIGRLT